MRGNVLQRFIMGGIFVLMGAVVSGDAHGLEEYIIGGEGRPWTESLDEVANLDMTNPWIQPMELTPEQNIVEGYEERGGYAQDSPGARLWGANVTPAMFDRDSTTALVVPYELRRMGYAAVIFPIIDLGGQFMVNKIVFFPRPDSSHLYLGKFQLYVNDGRPESYNQYGTPVFGSAQLVRQEDENKDVVVVTELDPPRLARYITIRPWQTKRWEIAEMEVFGEGFVPSASYTSEIVDFGEVASWGKIRWSGGRDPKAKVFIRTRTGQDDDPNIYWRRTARGDEIVNVNERGQPLTRKEFYELPIKERHDERGNILITYDSDNWSFWSAPYDFEAGFGGVPVTSPGPSRFFQLRVDFVSTSDDGGWVDFISFELSKPPAAQDVVAEIWPLEVEPARVNTFTYALTATIRGDNTGFDSLEILTPVEVDTVRSVRIDEGENLVGRFPPEIRKDRFVVHFPMLGVEDSGSLLEVEFDVSVLRYGTEFMGWVYDSGVEEVHQLVSSGDATLKFDGDELSVRTSLGGSLIASVAVSPNPFTPNGDGVNDVVELRYSLLRLTGSAPVFVDVYDLCGRLVRRVYSGEDINGEYVLEWDGVGDDGRVVPPGIYLYQITVDADEGSVRSVGVVSLAY